MRIFTLISLSLFLTSQAHAWVCTKGSDKFIKIRKQYESGTTYLYFLECSFREPDSHCFPITTIVTEKQLNKIHFDTQISGFGDQLVSGGSAVAMLWSLFSGAGALAKLAGNAKTGMYVDVQTAAVRGSNLTSKAPPPTLTKMPNPGFDQFMQEMNPAIGVGFGAIEGTPEEKNIVTRTPSGAKEWNEWFFGNTLNLEVLAPRFLNSGSQCEYYDGTISEYSRRIRFLTRKVETQTAASVNTSTQNKKLAEATGKIRATEKEQNSPEPASGAYTQP